LFVSESAVSKWEKDIAHPDITLLPKLADVLGVTEHELITASIDNNAREEKVRAKKWRALSLSWDLFFYISYGLAIITCFICNLAIEGTLSWFWIVLAALILSFTFTNLPKFIRVYRLILIPLSQYLALCLLLGVCAIYTRGDWFVIPALAVLLGLVIVFVPIYIAKYPVFAKIRKFNDFVSIAIDFVVLNILLVAIDIYTLGGGYTTSLWYGKLALPIVLVCYVIMNLFLCVKFLKVNGLLKTSIILFAINVIYLLSSFIRVDNPHVQKELDSLTFYKADLSNWQVDISLERNVHCIIFLSVFAVAIAFLIAGLVRCYKRKK
jgi:transcriptional regulator with XRE-family HTH domain